MYDPTETVRREQVSILNSLPRDRHQLEAIHGAVYDTDQLMDTFTVVSFLAPYVLVMRNEDGVRGTLLFQAHPRFYFSFSPG